MLSVVLVDDELVSAQALAILLAGAGLKVRIAEDGETGLRLISESRPDVVVTDFMMPTMTGLELARALRGGPDENTSRIPLILLSAAQADIGRQHPDMFDVILEKPCHPDQVLAAVLAVGAALATTHSPVKNP
ncbi:response regulator [Cupriavidus plantarum]|uniref:response regulator n=1 Tax=Cupriavidus plantarum TaxID=942865 RepID=UPI00339D4726